MSTASQPLTADGPLLTAAQLPVPRGVPAGNAHQQAGPPMGGGDLEAALDELCSPLFGRCAAATSAGEAWTTYGG